MGGSSNPPVSLPGEGVILNWTAYKRATVVVVPFDRTVSTFSGLGLFFFWAGPVFRSWAWEMSSVAVPIPWGWECEIGVMGMVAPPSPSPLYGVTCRRGCCLCS